ncbi:DUF2290 domain-containing protein [Paenibacillus sp. FSL F4-0243]|uniref:DUF2290 domain-containing protein n=1 Tax=Paenibacillus sp. FSL F4-0243 TaxID=2954732 RepID=UPI0030DBF96B
MNIASISTSINLVPKLLKESGLFKDSNKTRKFTLEFGKYSEEFVSVCQSDDYDSIYKVAMKNMDYDFLLMDDSILQFSCTSDTDTLDEGIIRYAFYENPRTYRTYEEFLSDLDATYEECGDEFLQYYEQEISEAKLKSYVTPIRYDYNYELYTPIEHSISHIHLGHNNNVRVATSKILTPAKFVSFVLRNVYTKKWINAYRNDAFKEICLTAHQTCHPINTAYFTSEEKKLLHIF